MILFSLWFDLGAKKLARRGGRTRSLLIASLV